MILPQIRSRHRRPWRKMSIVIANRLKRQLLNNRILKRRILRGQREQQKRKRSRLKL